MGSGPSGFWHLFRSWCLGLEHASQKDVGRRLGLHTEIQMSAFCMVAEEVGLHDYDVAVELSALYDAEVPVKQDAVEWKRAV